MGVNHLEGHIYAAWLTEHNPLDLRSSGKTQTQDTGCFVESFAGSIVPGPTQQFVRAVTFHQKQIGMSSRSDQTKQRESGIFPRVMLSEPGGVDVPFKVIDSHQRHAERVGDCFGGVQPGDQRTAQSGPVGYRYHVNLIQGHAAIGHRFFNHRYNVPDMLARSHLWNYTAVNGVKFHLRRDDVQARGSRSSPSAPSATLWISGPPGKPKPRIRAALSKASPAASSRVLPSSLYVP